MKKILFILLSAIPFVFSSCATPGSNIKDYDVLSQFSAIGALKCGVYDGNITCGDVKQFGDFGIGTFNGLDGEMVMLDGQIYQIMSDGVAYTVKDEQKTPFACVTFFRSDKKIKFPGGLTYKKLVDMLNRLTSDAPNSFYAVKVTGKFRQMKTRSVPLQWKPYSPLSEALKEQKIFNFENISGTIVGIKSPGYVGDMNVPGCHFHFLTADGKAGGHVLGFITDNITVEIDKKNNFFVMLPDTPEFNKAGINKVKNDDTEEIRAEDESELSTAAENGGE